MLSNGCHWIDHFLHLNDYSKPKEWRAWLAGRTLNCSIELLNGAEFTMALTDVGSPRIGLRELVEVRAGAASARIIDGRSYISEDARRYLRRTRFQKGAAHRLMYESFAARILAGDAGDSLASIEQSTQLTLSLDELIRSGA